MRALFEIFESLDLTLTYPVAWCMMEMAMINGEDQFEWEQKITKRLQLYVKNNCGLSISIMEARLQLQNHEFRYEKAIEKYQTIKAWFKHEQMKNITVEEPVVTPSIFSRLKKKFTFGSRKKSKQLTASTASTEVIPKKKKKNKHKKKKSSVEERRLKFYALPYSERNRQIRNAYIFVFDKYSLELPYEIAHVMSEYTARDDEEEEEYRIEVARCL
eukprot:UN33231